MADNPDYEGPKGKLLREKAKAFAEERSRLFNFATEKRNKGDHQGANEMVEQGKIMGERMKEANREAADAILHYNNSEKGFGVDSLDLHGLREEEAMEFLRARVNLLESSTPIGTVVNFTVIPGAGHHSGPAGQKLKRATISYFTLQHLQFQEVNAGQLLVHIPGFSTPLPDGTSERPATQGEGIEASPAALPAATPEGGSAPPLTPPKKSTFSSCCVC